MSEPKKCVCKCIKKIKKTEDFRFIKNQIQKYFSDNNITVKNNSLFLGDFQRQLTWLNVVDIGEDVNFDFLLQYGNFRKQIVDQLIALISKYVCKTCTVNAVGSVNPTSDYDITANGRKAAQLVQIFNQIFRELFLNESGIIFDTNLYGVGFFEPTQEVVNNQIFTTVQYISDGVIKNIIFIYPSRRKTTRTKILCFH